MAKVKNIASVFKSAKKKLLLQAQFDKSWRRKNTKKLPVIKD